MIDKLELLKSELKDYKCEYEKGLKELADQFKSSEKEVYATLLKEYMKKQEIEQTQRKYRE